MLPIDIFREDLDRVKTSQKKRFRKLDYPDLVVKYDNMWRDATKQVQALKAQKNKISKQIGQIKSQGGDTKTLEAQSKENNKKIPTLEEKEPELLANRDEY